ncbi:hypothetical protein BDP27DRAFT_1448173 [Rhodocollybia butyracea]|uniref:Uncharacterized protein n=1 Tax=Rhodocollybia butyracea TaxID=206335 RepID=A0A9P5U7G0_9AGAR|nr:hypothetical protein BDP27DRAFT_1448173 [Rhodocollybia butyracea]
MEVQLYRCYLLWNASKRVIFLPAFGIVVTTAAAITFQFLFQFGPVISGQILENSQEENSFFFPVYVISEIVVGLGLTILLASRIWWLNCQTEKFLGKSSQSTLRKLTEIVVESGILLPVFLGVALGINFQITPISGSDLFIAAIASTLIVVRIGLGADVQPLAQLIETAHYPDMDNGSADSLAPDLERATIYVDNSGPDIIDLFSLKYQDQPSGLALQCLRSKGMPPFGHSRSNTELLHL